MCKSQLRNTGNVKKQGNMTPLKLNSIATNTNNHEVDEIQDKQFKK
jgi:hypothetical protein